MFKEKDATGTVQLNQRGLQEFVRQNAAAAGAKEMRETQIVQPVEPNRGKLNNGQDNSSTNINTPNYRDSGEFRQGISGTVKQSL